MKCHGLIDNLIPCVVLEQDHMSGLALVQVKQGEGKRKRQIQLQFQEQRVKVTHIDGVPREKIQEAIRKYGVPNVKTTNSKVPQ